MRSPTMLDHEFIFECYQHWPVTELQGPVLESDVRKWIRRWMRDAYGEYCRMNEHGLITWRQGLLAGHHFATVDRILIHRDHRGQGHGKAMWRWLKDRLVAEGVEAATFDALPGVVADKTFRGDFIRIGEGIGKSGLPLVKGMVTAEMEI